MDQRIGSSFLGHGPGFGGSCLVKDLTGLIHAAGALGYQAPVARAALEVNTWARTRVVDKLATALGPLAGKWIAVLGLAFKPGTDDVRDSPGAGIVHRLLDLGATVTVHDPAATSPDLAGLMRDDAYLAARGADALVITTAWPEFAALEPARLEAAMTGHVVVDAVGVLDPGAAAAAGLEIITLGRGSPDVFHPVVVPPLEWCLDLALA